MKIVNLIEDLILEANKKDALINKLGLSNDNAEILYSLTGPLSIWMANKLIDYTQYHSSIGEETPKTKEQALDIINRGSGVRARRSEITSIMDWIRVGLNGNVNQYKNNRFDELYKLSREWHESLGTGEGEINYEEKNTVIRDYRKDGIGFYWVDLETNNSEEECNRMGHCGRTSSYNTIYSLREVKQINPQYTINKSHLTSAVGNSDGIIYQMKGPKNSKPKEEYHPYIVDLILNNEDIKGFGSEYDSSSDFKITDLPETEIKKIYDARPELFNTRALKRTLQKMGIGDYVEPEMVFTLEIDPSYVSRYVDGDWDVRRWKDSNGNTRTMTFIETLLSGDVWDLVDGYQDEWKSGLEYYTDTENEQRILEIIKKLAGDDFDPEESLENLIEEYDEEYEIRNSIGSAYSDAANSSYYDYAIKQLKSTLEEYGEVTQINDEGVKININLNDVIKNMEVSEEDLDEYFENCDDSPECVFDEILGAYYDKPNFRLDDRWYPDIDNDDFNSYLSDRLGDYEYTLERR
jgi:hypothetical protein